MTSTTFTDREREERREAVRLLLRHPVVTDTVPDPDGFVLVRRHARWLRDWFSRNPGFALVVDRDYARLHKLPARLGAGDLPTERLTRRRAAWFCLALAVLERIDGQTTLGYVAEELEVLAATNGLAAPNLADIDDRRAVAFALRRLADLGVVTRTDGGEDEFVAGTGDALYTVHRRLAARLLVAPRPPSTMAGPGELAEEFYPDTPEGRTRRVRHNVWRRLLDDPVVYHAELDDAENVYLRSQRHAIVAELRDVCGLVPEIRSEGIAAIEPRPGETELPAAGTVPYAALLVAGELVRAAEAQPGFSARVPVAQLRACLDGLRADPRCAQQYAADPELLLEQAVGLLQRNRLVACNGDDVVPLPAAARFACARR